MILLKTLSKQLGKVRFYSHLQAAPNVLEKLHQRTLLRVAGTEASDFLQGLITNDIAHLSQGVGSMYTMFLNTKGRILYDAIVYRTGETNMFLIECDREAEKGLEKHLKMYRVRRKIDVNSVDDKYEIYTLFNVAKLEEQDKAHSIDTKGIEGLVVPCSSLAESLPESSKTCKTYGDLLIYADPRLSNLGPRIITPKQSNAPTQISEIFQIDPDPNPNHSYCWFRYNLGIGEGVTDLPPGDSFPLESNCDYLHGVSFHKGCYIGQELTARTFHTGVVRKRLMPLTFSQVPTRLPNENKIVHEGVTLGKLRGVEGKAGLAVLKIAQVLELKELEVGNGKAVCRKPNWWPFEAPKERRNLQKN